MKTFYYSSILLLALIFSSCCGNTDGIYYYVVNNRTSETLNLELKTFSNELIYRTIYNNSSDTFYLDQGVAGNSSLKEDMLKNFETLIIQPANPSRQLITDPMNTTDWIVYQADFDNCRGRRIAKSTIYSFQVSNNHIIP